LLLRSLAAQGFFPTQAWLRQFLAQGFDPRQPELWFEARTYCVRAATHADLPILLHLEAACWPTALCASAEELQQRLTRFPEGQLALELDGALVGVIYAQRITDTAALSRHDFRSVAALHDPQGTIAQPLAINVLPAVQQYGLGDQLLEFFLQLATITPGISQVAAVTLCQAFAQQTLPMERYIEQRGATGLPVDPILAFHVAHGAQIRGVVEGYRPPDLANQGKGVLGICNGFQILTEVGLLPGALVRNRDMQFICDRVPLRIERTTLPLTEGYTPGQVITLPIAHGEGSYYADADTLTELEANQQVVLRYCDAQGNTTDRANPNGSLNNIAGICNRQGNVLGLMPHPERATDLLLGNTDGLAMFQGLLNARPAVTA